MVAALLLVGGVEEEEETAQGRGKAVSFCFSLLFFSFQLHRTRNECYTTTSKECADLIDGI